MKKELNTKTVALIIGVVVVAALWLGWKVILAPKPGEEPAPPASTKLVPSVPPGTYFAPGSQNSAVSQDNPDPAALQKSATGK